MAKKSVCKISKRSNIIHKRTKENEVIIYEDHRTILNVLFDLREIREISEPLDIYMFDQHDDFCSFEGNRPMESINRFLATPTKENLLSLVEFDLRDSDDDWVKAGMELGFINNVFLFNCAKGETGKIESYNTQNFGTKTLTYLGNVWDALGSKLLDDVLKYDGNPWLKDFGWKPINDLEAKHSFQPSNKFILDIDLDCFSINILEKTIAIPNEVIIPKLTEISKPNYHYYYNSQDFIKELIQKAEIATICYENGFCGGIRKSQQIFSMVDRVLFDGELSE
jgi:hypothetical protein